MVKIKVTGVDKLVAQLDALRAIIEELQRETLAQLIAIRYVDPPRDSKWVRSIAKEKASNSIFTELEILEAWNERFGNERAQTNH